MQQEEEKNEVEFIQSEFTAQLSLSYAPGIKAGFASPAEAYEVDVLDFNKDMIRHPDTTFYGRVRGDSMMDAGICDGDILVKAMLNEREMTLPVASTSTPYYYKWTDLRKYWSDKLAKFAQ